MHGRCLQIDIGWIRCLLKLFILKFHLVCKDIIRDCVIADIVHKNISIKSESTKVRMIFSWPILLDPSLVLATINFALNILRLLF